MHDPASQTSPGDSDTPPTQKIDDTQAGLPEATSEAGGAAAAEAATEASATEASATVASAAGVPAAEAAKAGDESSEAPAATATEEEAPPEAPADEPAANPFAGIPEALQQTLAAQGFASLTEVQQAVVDALRNEGEPRDLRISSRTGSGKTVALGMAIAPRLIAAIESADGRRAAGPTALIVVPTRELAAQVSKELDWLLARIPGVRVDSVTGGTSVVGEQRRLQRRPRILVGTPGRLVDHLGSGSLDCSEVAELVLDEADQMLDMGFSEDLDAIVAAMPKSDAPKSDAPKSDATGDQPRRRTHMVSATFSNQVLRVAQQYQRDALLIETQSSGEAHADIDHIGHVVEPRDRYKAVINHLLLAGERRVLIFVATRIATGELADKLANDGFAALPLSGDLAQNQRTRTLDAFRNGTVNVLVATDVAARGLDVPDVATVLHGDLPIDAETYTHRSGRTGRAGNKGRSILMATPKTWKRAHRIAHQAGADMDFIPPPGAEQVQRAIDGRLRKRLALAIEQQGLDCSSDERAFAETLMTDRDPVAVIAALVRQLRGDKAREPFDIAEAPRSGSRDRRDDSRDPRGPRAMPAQRRGSRDVESGFTRFRINWGGRQGANPKRILATLCRRGDVDGRMIGAIDIDGYETTFDVRNEVVAHFERNSQRPDNRDRDQLIERTRGGSRGGARGGSRGGGAPHADRRPRYRAG